MPGIRILCVCALLASPSLIMAQNNHASSTDVTVDTGTGTLSGSLLVPNRPGTNRVALIVAGSGPTDRNGNSPLIPGENNSLLYLAEELAESGIATLRYDKRGVGMSVAALTAEKDLTFDVYVDDVKHWVDYLHTTDQFESISIIGHSEGSLLALVAAQDVEVNQIISIAGAGFPADDILRKQLSVQLSPGSYATADSALTEIKESGQTDLRPAQGAALFRASIQQYLHSWFKYDPATVVSAVQSPVLIIQGTTDIQVGVDDAERLASANEHASLVIIEGMNHILKMVDSDMSNQTSSYSDPNLEVSDVLISAIAEFLNN